MNRSRLPTRALILRIRITQGAIRASPAALPRLPTNVAKLLQCCSTAGKAAASWLLVIETHCASGPECLLHDVIGHGRLWQIVLQNSKNAFSDFSAKRAAKR
jgi:hypothetical protein